MKPENIEKINHSFEIQAPNFESKSVNFTKEDKPLPHITPHVFRHTFCTNMANKGMDIKTLQYVMGHSDVSVTLNVYTHASYDRAAEQMAKIIDLKDIGTPEKQRKSG